MVSCLFRWQWTLRWLCLRLNRPRIQDDGWGMIIEGHVCQFLCFHFYGACACDGTVCCFLFLSVFSLVWLIFLSHMVLWDVVTMMWRGPAYSAVLRFIHGICLRIWVFFPSASYGQFDIGFPGVRCGKACAASGFALRATTYSAFACSLQGGSVATDLLSVMALVAWSLSDASFFFFLGCCLRFWLCCCCSDGALAQGQRPVALVSQASPLSGF